MVEEIVSSPEPVPHFTTGLAPLVSVYKLNGEQHLEHRMTGEVVNLKTQDDKLCNHGGFGFLKGTNSNCQWVNDIFKKSLWKIDGELAVKMPGHGGEGEVVQWLTEVRTNHEYTYASWEACSASPCKVGRLQVITYEVQRSGATVFLKIADLQRAAQFKTKFPASPEWVAKSMYRWTQWADAVSIPRDHIVRPCDLADGNARVEKPHMTIATTLLIFSKGAGIMREYDDRVKCMQVVRSTAANFIGKDFEIHLQRGIGNVPVEGGVPFRVRDLHVEACDGCLRELVGRPFEGALLSFLNVGKFLPYAPQLFQQLHILAEAANRILQWPSDPLLCLTPLGARSRCDRRIRTAVSLIPSSTARNAFRCGAIARRLNLDVPMHKSWVDNAYVKRYIMAFRKASEPALSIGLQFDKGRRSGADQMRGKYMSYEGRIFGHLMPLAPQPQFV